MKCIICQKECDSYICEECRSNLDVDAFAEELRTYRASTGENEFWNSVIEELGALTTFKEQVTEDFVSTLDSPLKEYYTIVIPSYGWKVSKKNYDYLFDCYDRIIDDLSPEQQNRLKGMLLDALWKDYKYSKAEDLAKELSCCEDNYDITHLVLAEYYIITRRYEKADEILDKVPDTYNEKTKLLEKNEKQKANRDAGKKEYVPNPKENKEEVKKAYVEFIQSLGMDIVVKKSTPKPITWADYPEIIETTDPTFDSFVAFDLETTGFSPKTDSIIDFGAIKVVSGEVVESKEFIFQELCKPFKSKVDEHITELTGIAPDMVKDARPMWEVMNDFMDFVGDYPLVGYNCVKFDAEFLRRAGRYTHRVIENPVFDVMKYAQSKKNLLGTDDLKLGSLTDYFGIENKRAHRALPDAVATAEVFLKLKEV